MTSINSKLLTVSLAFSISAFTACGIENTCDHWVDKDEDENYTPRHECSFVQAGNSFIMFGGRESSQRLDTYDFENDAWTLGGEAPKEFNHFQATFYQGFIWVIGAFQTNAYPREKPEESIWLYFPHNKSWIQGPKIPKHRQRGSTGLVVHNNKFYVLGGNTLGHDGGYVNWFDEYDPESNQWNELKPASQARDHFHAAVIDNKLYAAGGRQSGGEGGVFAPLIGTVDVYDFKTQSWSILDEDLPTPRAAPGIAAFKDQLFVIGGESEEPGPAYKIVESYNPQNNSWSRKADMTYPRHGTQAIVSGKGIYIAGGSHKRGGGRQLNMEVYSEDSPQTDPIRASKLKAPTEINIQKGESTEITIDCSGGNTGCFITEATIEGEYTNGFKLESNIKHNLLLANTSRSIKISNTEKTPATLRISYNGSEELILKLTSD